MQEQLNPKMVGSVIIGFALVFGAITIRNMTTPYEPATMVATTQVSTAPTRTPISVIDSDGNGIEDWRDEFITSKPVQISQDLNDYTLPDTVTGKMSINLFENLIQAKGAGPFGSDNEKIINSTVNNLVREVDTKLYNVSDIDVMTNYDGNDVKNYANTLAAIIYNNSQPLDGELEILYDILNNGAEHRVKDLKTLVSIYKNYRDDTLKLPVPASMVKEHLDLINVYQALHDDINAMSEVLDDPMVSLLYIKRYEENAVALIYALENIYLNLKPYGNLFSAEDPAMFFALFNPELKI